MNKRIASCRTILLCATLAAAFAESVCLADEPGTPFSSVRLLRPTSQEDAAPFSDQTALLGGPNRVDQDARAGDQAPKGPDISEPGPDSADLPDSAFAVPPGVAYLETSFSYKSTKGPRVRDYFTSTLVRAGLWEDFELRISTPGVIQEHGPDESTTGFGPLTLGFKQHIWGEVEECGIPAFGIIAQVTTPTASAGFDDGTAVPTLFFNFDYTLPCDSYFEVNFGISGVHADDGHRFAQGSILWSLGHEWNDSFTTFFHGFANVPAGSGEQEELLMGPGLIWFISKQVAMDFSYNFGLSDESDHRFLRLGLNVAF